MPSPPWPIHPCTLTDAPSLAHNNMSAFWTDPTWILLWPPPTTLPYLITQSAKRQPRNLLRDREHIRHQKAVDPGDGRLVGYARWVLPDVKREGEGVLWLEAQVEDVSSEERKRLDEVAESAWWEPVDMRGIDDVNEVVMGRILGERPYIKLDYLAVHPDNKGKGIATALVESGIQQAVKLGIPLFVLSYKAGRGVYERLGFREVERIIQDDSKWGGKGEYGAYFMVYDVPEVVEL